MPYRVTIQDSMLQPLPSSVRTRVWLELAHVAQLASDYPSPRPDWVRQLGIESQPKRFVAAGYAMSYALDDGARTVTLLEVEQQPNREWLA